MKTNKLINLREISRRLTGSPNRIRHDFVPDEYRGVMNKIRELEALAEGVIKRAPEQTQKPVKFERS